MKQQRGRWWGGLVVVAALALTGCPSPSQNSAGPAAGSKTDVRAVDFAFEPKEIGVRAGDATFSVTNAGNVEHNFVIEDASGATVAQIPNISVKKTLEVTAKGLRPGKYTMVCTLPGHKDAGMVGTITVQ